ncbi:MAG: SMP-30/gluconolactonase/LRE family protein [Chloroflexi bacterium]|nr:SMP-30/gluconolactonase/LRE family protein [Chloroflexota bacterium]
MAHDARPRAGSLDRLDVAAAPQRVLGDLAISNGIAWSPDDRLMSFIDSATHRGDVLDDDPATGRATGRRPLPPAAGRRRAPGDAVRRVPGRPGRC